MKPQGNGIDGALTRPGGTWWWPHWWGGNICHWTIEEPIFLTRKRVDLPSNTSFLVLYIYSIYIYINTRVCVCRISQFKEAKQHLKMAEETSTQHHTKPPAQFRHKTEPGNTVFSSLCPRALQIQYPSTWSLRMSSVGKVCIQLINGACLMMYTSALRFKWFRGS